MRKYNKEELQELQSQMQKYLDIRKDLVYNDKIDDSTKYTMFLEMEEIGNKLVKEFCEHDIVIDDSDITRFIIKVKEAGYLDKIIIG